MGNQKKRHKETCIKCGRYDWHYAKGLCRGCYNRRWEKKHPKWLAEYSKKYRETHKEEIAKRHHDWYQKNKWRYKKRYLTRLGNEKQNKAVLEFIRRKRLGLPVKKYKPLPLSAFEKPDNRNKLY
jgi:hypothetical protein